MRKHAQEISRKTEALSAVVDNNFQDKSALSAEADRKFSRATPSLFPLEEHRQADSNFSATTSTINNLFQGSVALIIRDEAPSNNKREGKERASFAGVRGWIARTIISYGMSSGQI